MNNHKLKKLSLPGMGLLLVVMVLFAAVTSFISKRLALIEAGVIVLLGIYLLIRLRRQRRELQSFAESITYNAESATNNTLIHFPLPMAVFRLSDSSVVWGNQPFWTMCGRSAPSFDAKLTHLVPEFNGKWLMEGKTRLASLLTVDGKKYEVNGNMVRSGNNEDTYEFMGITYWVDVTEYDDIKLEYMDSRPIVMVILIDNYEELMKPLTDRQRTELRGVLDEAVEKWCSGRGGIFRRVERDRFLFIFERRYFDEITKERFTLVESIHSIVSPTGIHATVSIGVGMDGENYEEDYSFAMLASDMALSRGGDQAVVKNRFNFEFFGGRGTEVETRTKVRSRVMASSLAKLIQDASAVMVMGHRFSDIDSVGAAAGVCCIARTLGCPAKIVIDRDKTAAGSLVELLEQEDYYRDGFISPDEAILRADNRTLLIVVDTQRPEQVEDESLLTACSNRLAVIDHHRRAATYIPQATLTLYEPNASSACELVTEILQELVEQKEILQGEADAMLAGIVLDTKNFTIRTGDRTFDAAAFLRRAGADTLRVKKLFQNNMDEAMARFDIMKNAKLHRGVAVAAADKTMDRVVAAQAADELLNISGVTATAVLIPMQGGGVAISARSIGNINVQVLLEKLGGGGNHSVAGAQIPDISMRDAFNALCKAIDEYVETE